MIRLRFYTHAQFQLPPIFKALRITLFKVRLLKTAQVYDSRYNGFLQD